MVDFSYLFLWGLMSYGMTSIIVWGSIFNWLRDLFREWSEVKNGTRVIGKFLKDLTSCMLCTSTWVGFFMGYFVDSPTGTLFSGILTHDFYWFFDGVFSAGFVWALNSIIEWYENK